MLQIGSQEENEVLLLLQRWLDETQGFVRRESLMDADLSTLQGRIFWIDWRLSFCLQCDIVTLETE